MNFPRYGPSCSSWQLTARQRNRCKKWEKGKSWCAPRDFFSQCSELLRNDEDFKKFNFFKLFHRKLVEKNSLKVRNCAESFKFPLLEIVQKWKQKLVHNFSFLQASWHWTLFVRSLKLENFNTLSRYHDFSHKWVIRSIYRQKISNESLLSRIENLANRWWRHGAKESWIGEKRKIHLNFLHLKLAPQLNT